MPTLDEIISSTEFLKYNTKGPYYYNKLDLKSKILSAILADITDTEENRIKLAKALHSELQLTEGELATLVSLCNVKQIVEGAVNFDNSYCYIKWALFQKDPHEPDRYKSAFSTKYLTEQCSDWLINSEEFNAEAVSLMAKRSVYFPGQLFNHGASGNEVEMFNTLREMQNFPKPENSYIFGDLITKLYDGYRVLNLPSQKSRLTELASLANDDNPANRDPARDKLIEIAERQKAIEVLYLSKGTKSEREFNGWMDPKIVSMVLAFNTDIPIAGIDDIIQRTYNIRKKIQDRRSTTSSYETDYALEPVHDLLKIW